MTNDSMTILSLGDSYTIGESVPLYESFPYQTVQLVRRAGKNFNAPEIIAKTGWTTDELIAGIASMKLQSKYDYVTLLIGVNNQYRGRSVHEFEHELHELMKQAIQFAGNNSQHVIVLSIPDWGVTPFAAGRDTAAISKEIDAYNAVNKKLSEQYKTHYIDITPGTREASNDPSLLTSDKLHYSAKEYGRWAEKVAIGF